MPMLRCAECGVHQYAATPYVEAADCVRCGRPLLPPRPPWTAPPRVEPPVAETRA
jgi:hypothetical protein